LPIFVLNFEIISFSDAVVQQLLEALEVSPSIRGQNKDNTRPLAAEDATCDINNAT